MPKIVLHQWEMSPFCNKVRRCLRIKGLAFDVQDYNGLLARDAAKLSKVGTLPVLDYDGERIVDSHAIAEFLDRTHPDKPLYPQDPEALAMARFWEDWAAQSLYFHEIYWRMLDPDALEKALDLISKGRAGYERSILKVVFKRRYPPKLRQQGLGKLEKEEVLRIFLQHLEGLETILARRAWLVGDAETIADVSVAAQLDEIVRTSQLADRVLGFPKIKEWLARAPQPS